MRRYMPPKEPPTVSFLSTRTMRLKESDWWLRQMEIVASGANKGLMIVNERSMDAWLKS
jgi:hypothetical protein